MQQLAEGLWRLPAFPPHAINVYLAGDVLIDAGTKLRRRRLLKQLAGVPVAAHALTHAHPDHYGSSHEVCAALGIPLWCPAGDVAAVEGGGPVRADTLAARLIGLQPAPPSHPVDRALSEGDEVGGFTVLHTFGHSPGHVSYWREADRVLIVGDVFFNTPSLRPPLRAATVDPEENRRSMRRLADLQPALAVFGHGPPLRDPEKLSAFVNRHVGWSPR